MKLYHKQPCKECPWRHSAPAGWLGGWPPELYTDAVTHNEVPACHCQDYGPDSDYTAMCAGALAVMANACIQPYRTLGGAEAVKVVGSREDCFRSPRDFYQHHTGMEYVHPLLRRKQS